MSQEQRKHPRRMPRMKVPVSLVLAAGEIQATIYDFSMGGISVFSPRQVTKGDSVKITIISGKICGTLLCTAMWNASLPSKEKIISDRFPQWRLGLRFEIQSEEDKKFIALLNECL